MHVVEEAWAHCSTLAVLVVPLFLLHRWVKVVSVRGVQCLQTWGWDRYGVRKQDNCKTNMVIFNLSKVIVTHTSEKIIFYPSTLFTCANFAFDGDRNANIVFNTKAMVYCHNCNKFFAHLRYLLINSPCSQLKAVTSTIFVLNLPFTFVMTLWSLFISVSSFLESYLLHCLSWFDIAEMLLHRNGWDVTTSQ